jgi:holo-[acyl-carrier protein] synthase
MVKGIGVDVIEIERVKQVFSYHQERFLRRIMDEEELKLLGHPIKISSLAARFAAKEAVSKALGTGITGFSWRDIRLESSKSGEPVVKLMGEASNIAKKKGVKRILVSWSHCLAYVVAMAVAEG